MKPLGVALLALLTACPFAFSSVSAQSEVQPCLASSTDETQYIEVRARKLPFGGVEFSLRINGTDYWEPPNRYLMYNSAVSGVWLYSSECLLSDGRAIEIRVRKLASGNIEFGLRIDKSSTWIPKARFFTYTAATINSWFYSSEFKVVDDLVLLPPERHLWTNGEFAPLSYDVEENTVSVLTRHDASGRIDAEAMLKFNRYFDYTLGNRFQPSKWVGIGKSWTSSSNANGRFVSYFINNYRSRDDIPSDAKVYALNWDEDDEFHLFSHGQPVALDDLSTNSQITMEEFERQISAAQINGGNTTFDVKYDQNGVSIWRLYPHTVFWTVDMRNRSNSRAAYNELWGVKAVPDTHPIYGERRKIIALDPVASYVDMSVEVVGMVVSDEDRLEFPREQIEFSNFSGISERGGGIIIYVDIFDAETGRLLEQKTLSTGENGHARFIVNKPFNGHDVVVQMSRGGFRSPYCRTRTGANQHAINTRSQCIQEIISWDGDYVPPNRSSGLELIPLEESD